MALPQKQVVEIALATGICSGTDPKVDDKNTTMQNCQVTKLGEVCRRLGFSKVGFGTYGELPNGNYCTNFRKLVYLDGQPHMRTMMTRSTTINGVAGVPHTSAGRVWVRGMTEEAACPDVEISASRADTGAPVWDFFDSASLQAGYDCVAAIVDNGGVYSTVVTITDFSGVVLYRTSTLIQDATFSPRTVSVCSRGTKFYVVQGGWSTDGSDQDIWVSVIDSVTHVTVTNSIVRGYGASSTRWNTVNTKLWTHGVDAFEVASGGLFGVTATLVVVALERTGNHIGIFGVDDTASVVLSELTAHSGHPYECIYGCYIRATPNTNDKIAVITSGDATAMTPALPLASMFDNAGAVLGTQRHVGSVGGGEFDYTCVGASLSSKLGAIPYLAANYLGMLYIATINSVQAYGFKSDGLQSVTASGTWGTGGVIVSRPFFSPRTKQLQIVINVASVAGIVAGDVSALIAGSGYALMDLRVDDVTAAWSASALKTAQCVAYWDPGQAVTSMLNSGQYWQADCLRLPKRVDVFTDALHSCFPLADKVDIAAVKKTRTRTNMLSGGCQCRIQSTYIDYNPVPAPAIPADHGYIVGGGFASLIDGNVQELGFFTQPGLLQIESGVTVGERPAPYPDTVYGTYIYEWLSLKGLLYRSTAAPIKSAVWIAEGEATLESMQCLAAYRALGAPDKMFKLQRRAFFTPPHLATLNACPYGYAGTAQNALMATPPGGTLDDTLTDLGTSQYLSQLEQLPEDAGEVASTQMPACHMLVGFKDKVLAVPDTDRTKIWISKPAQGVTGIEFSGVLILDLPKGGDITGLGVMDDNVLVFKEKAIFVLSGDGPDACGQGGFAIRELANTEGCRDRNSVVTTAVGTLFKSAQGYYMLDRNFQTKFVGREVLDYSPRTVWKAEYQPSTNAVFIVHDPAQSTDILKLNLETGMWEVWMSNAWGDLVDIVDVAGVLKILRSEGSIYTQDGLAAGVYCDDTQPTQFKLRTPWVHVAGIAGFSRIWEIMLEGEFAAYSAGDGNAVTVNLYYDYSDTIAQTITFQPAAACKNLRIKPARQKCKAISFEVAFAGKNLNIKLSNAQLMLGVKPGKLNRVPSSSTK